MLSPAHPSHGGFSPVCLYPVFLILLGHFSSHTWLPVISMISLLLSLSRTVVLFLLTFPHDLLYLTSSRTHSLEVQLVFSFSCKLVMHLNGASSHSCLAVSWSYFSHSLSFNHSLFISLYFLFLLYRVFLFHHLDFSFKEHPFLTPACCPIPLPLV